MGWVHNSERRQNFPRICGTATLGELLHELLNLSLDGGLAVGLCNVDVDFCDVRVVHQRRLWTMIKSILMQTHLILTIFHYIIKMSFILMTLKYDSLGTIFKEINVHTLKASFIELISFSSLTQNLVTPIA